MAELIKVGWHYESEEEDEFARDNFPYLSWNDIHEKWELSIDGVSRFYDDTKDIILDLME